MIEELAASTWRQRRCWAVETRMVDVASSRNGAPSLATVVSAYAELAESPALNLIQRYETRVHRMYQRALNNLLLFRQCAELPNEPSPDFEHALPQDEPQDEDPEPEPKQSRDSNAAVVPTTATSSPAKPTTPPAPGPRPPAPNAAVVPTTATSSPAKPTTPPAPGPRPPAPNAAVVPTTASSAPAKPDQSPAPGPRPPAPSPWMSAVLPLAIP
jgi:hypothetical protein